jgi:hypothetical protein
MAEPGFFTKVRPVASRPLESVYFANTDSIAPVSDIGGGAETGRKGAEWFEALAKGKSAEIVGSPLLARVAGREKSKGCLPKPGHDRG